jgi:hypothetical protein
MYFDHLVVCTEDRVGVWKLQKDKETRKFGVIGDPIIKKDFEGTIIGVKIAH